MDRDSIGLPLQPDVVGELRQLVVVFVDLVGSTDLSTRVDAEDYARLILAYQETGRQTFSGYGGRIAQYLGDGLLVYFGYPRAHENDAERAVRASLELLAALRSFGTQSSPSDGLQARIGLHAGEAVVGESQHGGRSVLFGETINVAARIQAHARPGTVLVSAAVMSLLKPRFNTRGLGPVSFKGVRHPIRLHRILRAVAPGTHPDLTDGTGPLLGRAAPLARLKDLWRKAIHEGPVAASITGEPGIGKTRLLRELRSELADTPHTWLEVQCDPLSTSAPLHPFITLIRKGLGITPGMAADEGLKRIERALAGLNSAPDDAATVIARLLGFTDHVTNALDGESPENLRHKTFVTLGQWITQLAARRPVLLVCEDLHWSDAASVEFLERLLSQSPPSRLLCITAQRPDPAIVQPAKSVELIALDSLDPPDARRLAIRVAAPAELDDAVLDDILGRAAGNPLFIEELARFSGQIQTGQRQNAGVPPTLNGLIMERLDELPKGPKQTAQVASALGQEFELSLLTDVAQRDDSEIEENIAELLHADILRLCPGSNVNYMFRHALTRDAAYGTLLRAERTGIHARAADCIQKDGTGRAADQPDIVAYHLHESLQFADAAIWYRKAGLRAVKQAAVEDATVLYRRALAALGRSKETIERDKIELSVQILLENAIMGVRGFASPEIKPVLERALELAERLEDRDETSSVLNGLAAYYLDKGDSEKGIDFADRILAMPGSQTDRIGRLRAHTTLAFARFQVGEGAAAADHAEKAISLYRPSDFATVTYGVGTDQGVLAYGVGGIAHWWLGRPSTALRRARAAVALAESLDSALSLAAARTFLVFVLHWRADTVEAHRIATENHEMCTRLGIPLWGGLSQLLRAGQPVDPPDVRQTEADAALAALAKTGSKSGIGVGFTIMAATRLANGDPGTAVSILDTGLTMAEHLNQPTWNSELARLKARALVVLGQPSEAETLLRSTLNDAAASGAASLGLRCALSLSDILSDTGRENEAVRLVAECASRIESDADTADLRRAADIIRHAPTSRISRKGYQ